MSNFINIYIHIMKGLLKSLINMNIILSMIINIIIYIELNPNKAGLIKYNLLYKFYFQKSFQIPCEKYDTVEVFL